VFLAGLPILGAAVGIVFAMLGYPAGLGLVIAGLLVALMNYRRLRSGAIQGRFGIPRR
jgi:hypothetical protein